MKISCDIPSRMNYFQMQNLFMCNYNVAICLQLHFSDVLKWSCYICRPCAVKCFSIVIILLYLSMVL